MDDFSWTRNISESKTDVQNYTRWSTRLLANIFPLYSDVHTKLLRSLSIHNKYTSLNLTWWYFAISSFYSGSSNLNSLAYEIKNSTSIQHFKRQFMFDEHSFILIKWTCSHTRSLCRVYFTVNLVCYYCLLCWATLGNIIKRLRLTIWVALSYNTNLSLIRQFCDECWNIDSLLLLLIRQTLTVFFFFSFAKHWQFSLRLVNSCFYTTCTYWISYDRLHWT